MKKYMILSIGAILGGCSFNTALYQNPTGEMIYEVRCQTLGKCYQRANDQCSGSFEILDKIVDTENDTIPIQIIYKCHP